MEPLASKIRPKTLEHFAGQEHLVGPSMPLRIAIEQKRLFSFILWGPPGVGKTTIARIYAHALDAEFYDLSAVSAGKEDIKRIAADRTLLSVRPKILFLDEIHRFNKTQQDFLLPFVESGEIMLIGATTENPSFEVIPALLSRCRVFVLKELGDEEMKKIIDRAWDEIKSETKKSSKKILKTIGKLDEAAMGWLIRMANGDARQAISVLENAAALYDEITVEALNNTIQNKFLRFDKKGDEHYNTISAFIKSLRANQPDAALYYLARMIDAGEDPKFIARRMVIFASEDIGMADPNALVVANQVFQAVDAIGLPEAQINLGHGTVYLATAPKDRGAYNAYFEALEDAKEHGNLPIPMIIRNAPTKLMKELGYHKNYELYTKENLLPDKLKSKKYYKPKGKA